MNIKRVAGGKMLGKNCIDMSCQHQYLGIQSMCKRQLRDIIWRIFSLLESEANQFQFNFNLSLSTMETDRTYR
jgi:hypothetical protein